MSVFKVSNTPYFQYDFQIQGRRFRGSTGQTSRRAAEAYEQRLRRDFAEGKLGEASQLTLSQAAAKYWLEHGQHRGDADQQHSRIKRLIPLFPDGIKLAEIETSTVSEAIQKRRGILFKKGQDRAGRDGKVIRAKEYAVSNATVNRDVIQTLRPILRRAARIWGAKGLNTIAWDEVALPVGRPGIRVYSQDELAAWTAENGPTAALALRLLTRYGLRFGELFFPLHAFEAEGPRLAWYKGRKKDVWHTVPLLPDDAQEIAARVGRARAADLDTIWYVEEVEQGEDGEAAIKLVAMTYYGLQQRLRTSSKRAGIRQGRVIHGARHHVGTTIQRAFKDRKVTQRLLGHLDSRSTDVYVHAMDEDVRTALEMANPGATQASGDPQNIPRVKPTDRKIRAKSKASKG